MTPPVERKEIERLVEARKRQCGVIRTDDGPIYILPRDMAQVVPEGMVSIPLDLFLKGQ